MGRSNSSEIVLSYVADEIVERAANLAASVRIRFDLLQERPQGPAQHQDQRPVAPVFSLDGNRRNWSGDRGLPLRRTMKKLPNIHPGEVLLEEFLVPMQISQNALARAAGVPPRRINEIILGKRGITADTALRLAAVFGTSEGFWLGLQADYDLEEARALIGKDLMRVEQAGAQYRAAKS